MVGKRKNGGGGAGSGICLFSLPVLYTFCKFRILSGCDFGNDSDFEFGCDLELVTCNLGLT